MTPMAQLPTSTQVPYLQARTFGRSSKISHRVLPFTDKNDCILASASAGHEAKLQSLLSADVQ